MSKAVSILSKRMFDKDIKKYTSINNLIELKKIYGKRNFFWYYYTRIKRLNPDIDTLILSYVTSNGLLIPTVIIKQMCITFGDEYLKIKREDKVKSIYKNISYQLLLYN